VTGATETTATIDAVHRLMPLIFGAVQGQAVRAAAELGLADLLRHGPRSAAQLAAATGTRAASLARLLRLLARLGVVEEQACGSFAVTALGALLGSDHPYTVRHYALMNNSEWILRVESRLQESLRTGSSAFHGVFGSNCYEYLGRHPQDGRAFHESLNELSQQDTLALGQVYDFSACRRLVDVGGGEGHLLEMLLDAHPSMRGVLFDLPEVVANAEPRLRAHVAAGRCELLGGNFLTTIPAGGDLYLLKRVISTSSQADARSLLEGIRAVIPPGGRLLLADPDPRSLYGALFDVLMMVVVGGALQTEEEIRAVLEETGFRCTRSVTTPSTLRLIEAVPE
jgi:hypothetical protein